VLRGSRVAAAFAAATLVVFRGYGPQLVAARSTPSGRIGKRQSRRRVS
jgi:hypothetical protein